MNDITITFIGDLLCGETELKLLLEGGHSFDELFADVQGLWRDSDYVVGNLETPLAGEQAGYTKIRAYFNTPKGIAESAKKAGIDFVTTANNHCWDRGRNGLDETLRNLDEIGLAHTGTYASKNESEKIAVVDIGGVRFAFVAGTYGINTDDLRPEAYRDALSEDEEWRIDLLSKPPVPHYAPPSKPPKPIYPDNGFLKNLVRRIVPLQTRQAVSVLRRGLPQIEPPPPTSYWSDCIRPEVALLPENELRLKRFTDKIARAKGLADVVVALPHVGGQFNPFPGTHHRHVIEALVKAGADHVIAGHSHNPQPATIDADGRMIVNSLGNFICKPYSGYFVFNICAEYGVVVSLMFSTETKRMIRHRFDYVRNIVEKDGFAKPMPVDVLIERETDPVAHERLVMEKQFVRRIVEGVYAEN